MDLRCLETVLKVAKCKGFSSAEEETTYTQSAISKQVKAVENEFGIKLFNREPKHFSVTPEGELFLEYAEDLMKSYSKLSYAAEMIQYGEIGKIRLAFTTKYAGGCGERELTSGFISKYPEIDVSIVNTAGGQVMPVVEAGKADAGLVILAGQAEPEKFSDKYYMLPVRKSRITFAIGKGHRLYHAPDEIDFAELDGEQVFLPLFTEPYFENYAFCQRLKEHCSSIGIKPNFLLRTEYGGDRALYAIKGMIVPFCSDVPVNSYQNIRFLRLKEEPFPVEVWMVALKSNMSAALMNFFNYAHQQYELG